MRDAAELRRADTDARQRALAVDRSFIVQAPAGSGKTELLAQRFLRLLAIVDRPEEILAITFTQKAAAEMRERIVAALRLAASGDTPEAPHRRLTAELAAAALARSNAKDWSLLDATERLRIQTVDAFCRELALRTPLSAGAAAYAATITDTEAERLYREAARCVLDWLTDTIDSTRREAVDRLLSHLDNDVDRWSRQIGELLAIREQWLPLLGGQAQAPPRSVRTTLESALARRIETVLVACDRRIASHDKRTVLEAATSAASVLDGSDRPQRLACWLDRAAWPRATVDEFGAWRELAAWLMTQNGQTRARLTVNEGFEAGNRDVRDRLLGVMAGWREDPETAAALAAIADLPDPAFDDAHWTVMQSLLQVLPLAAAELDLTFQQRAVTDFNAIVAAALAAVGDDDDPGHLAMLLDHRLRHILVDEMQDTSLVQYELLGRLTAGWQPGDGRTLFCVGDPMQSIYRFRQADVGRFLLARESGVGAVALEALTLCVNFRSVAPLIDWCNRAFQSIFPTEADALSGAVTHAPSVAPDSSEVATEAVSLHPVLATERGDEARSVAAVVADELAAGGNDIVVLAPSRASLLPVAAALRDDGLPYDSIEVDELAGSGAVQPVLAIVRALAHPLDRIGWLGLLRAPWVGLSLDELVSFCRGDLDRPVLAMLDDPDCLSTLSAPARRRVDRLRTALQATLDDVVTGFADRVESLWYRLGGPLTLERPDDVDSVYRLLSVVRDLSVDGKPPAVDRLYAVLDRYRVTTVAPGETRVRLMTIHKAKGLEFDCVIVTGLGRIDRSDSVRLLRWLTLPDADTRDVTVISLAASRRETQQDPLHSYLGKIESERQLNERDRLLYVAVTRARRHLHLVGHVARDANVRVKPPPPRSLLARLWPVVGERFEAAAVAADTVAAAAHGAGTRRVPAVRRLPDDAWRPSAPTLPRARLSRPRNLAEPEYAWVGALARHVGVVTHLALEHLARSDDSDASVGAALDAAERYLVTSGLHAAERDRVLRQCRRLVRSTLTDPDGRWLLYGEHRQQFSELALSGQLGDELHSVVIDRVIEDSDGTHWIVDYKTGWHGGGNPESFLAAEVERYRPQLERYRALYERFCGECARIALYYPSFGRLVEIQPMAN